MSIRSFIITLVSLCVYPVSPFWIYVILKLHILFLFFPLFSSSRNLNICVFLLNFFSVLAVTCTPKGSLTRINFRGQLRYIDVEKYIIFFFCGYKAFILMTGTVQRGIETRYWNVNICNLCTDVHSTSHIACTGYVCAPVFYICII